MTKTELTSVDQVFKKLGTETIAKLCKANKDDLYNWRRRFKQFPANTYCILEFALQEQDCVAPPHLWGMRGFKKKPR